MFHEEQMPSVNSTDRIKSKALLKKKDEFVARGISTAYPLIVDEANGAIVKDIDGNIYLDFYGGIGVINVGHSPESFRNAIKDQIDKFLHTCFMVAPYNSYIDLAEKIANIIPGNFQKKAIFINSGAEAVENAVKIARYYRKRSGIIAFESAFHGRTLLTMTLTSKVKPYKFGFGPFAPEVYKVPSAYCYRCIFNSTYPKCGLYCLEYIERFFITEADSDQIAAMIIEPVQGEGGFIVQPKEFLVGLKALCEKYGILYINDEVQSGFARTGKMFAIEHFDVVPDLTTMAKSIAAGLPLSSVAGKAEIMDAPPEGYLGGTFGGNPVSCVAGLSTIDFIEKNNLCAKAGELGEKLMKQLKILQEKYENIGDVRGLGAMVAIEFVRSRKTKEPAKELVKHIVNEAFNMGLLLMSAGIYGNVIRFLTPLIITEGQLEEGLSILERAIVKSIKLI
jgi:4-aminobutyrate aminotransferase/(S)-3-amino-2-methylpropionate transaminase